MLTHCLAACAHLTITVSEIERDIGKKNAIFHTPPLFSVHVESDPVRILKRSFFRENRNKGAIRW